jgi:hypothetical protein
MTDRFLSIFRHGSATRVGIRGRRVHRRERRRPRRTASKATHQEGLVHCRHRIFHRWERRRKGRGRANLALYLLRDEPTTKNTGLTSTLPRSVVWNPASRQVPDQSVCLPELSSRLPVSFNGFAGRAAVLERVLISMRRA